jgi:membrane protease YdiL (CAAX protease family)
MNRKNFVSPSKKEVLIGAVYMAVQMFALPYLIVAACDALGLTLTSGQMNVIFFIINFGATTLIFRNFLKRTFLDAGNGLFKLFSAALFGFGIYWLGNLLVGTLIYQINPDFANVNDASISAMAEANFLPIAICTIFFVPITEELLYRGVLFAGFFKRSPILAFIVSALIFSAIHVVGYITEYSWDTLLLCFIQYIPPSIALGFAYAKSGSIFAPMLMHIFINAIGILILR